MSVLISNNVADLADKIESKDDNMFYLAMAGVGSGGYWPKAPVSLDFSNNPTHPKRSDQYQKIYATLYQIYQRIPNTPTPEPIYEK